MVLQEFVYQKEKAEKVAKSLERLNKIKKEKENYYDQEIKSDSSEHVRRPRRR